MEFLLTKSIIKRLCGEASYKKGEAYYLAKKVDIKNFDANSPIIEAGVKGDSLFYVTIQNVKKGYDHAACTCPSLASFDTYCQHIAAVLHFLLDTQKNDGFSRDNGESAFIHTANIPEALTRDSHLANEMLSLFRNKSMPPSSNQDRFETREIIQVEFTCRPFNVGNGGYLLGIEANVGTGNFYTIHNLREFLGAIERRKSYIISPNFTCNPEMHSFQKDTDAVIRQLISIHHNEKIYVKTFNNQALLKENASENRMILIPPSFWEGLFPLLSAAPLVKIEHDGKIFNGVRLSNVPIPLRFEFEEAKGTGYRVDVRGLNGITILESYGYVLSEGEMIKLPDDECKRLVELKQMLDKSGMHQFAIPSEQMEHFLEIVIPGLMKLGQVKIAQVVSERLVKTPLNINVNVNMYTFDCLGMYTFVNPPSSYDL